MKTNFYYLLALLLTLGITEKVTAQGDPADALVHSYTFEDGTAGDQVGAADGTLVGGAAIIEGSLVITDAGQSMEMPGEVIGINSFEEVTVEILYTPSEGANTGFTMLSYFGATNSANSRGVDYFFMSTARGDDVSRAAISVGEDAEPFLTETGVNGMEYDDGQLHHMVSTVSASQIALYIDGQQEGTADLVAPNTLSGVSTDLAMLGRGGYTDDASWIGAIHEFNIYDRVLTAEEVASLYAQATDVEDDAAASRPEVFGFAKSYPNPFRQSTTIEYAVAEPGAVTIAVYDLLGNRIATLADGQRAPGTYTLRFDRGDLASGVYFCTMQAGSYRDTRKLIVLQ